MFNLHNELMQRGVDSTLVSIEAVDPSLQATNLVDLKCQSSYDLVAPVRLLRYLRKNVAPGDIVHAHLFPSNFYVSLFQLAGFSSGPRVTTEHSTFNRRRGRWYGRILDKIMYAGYRRVVAISQGVCDALVVWQPQLRTKVKVVTNGLQLDNSDFVQKCDRNQLVVLSVGNLREAKNYPITLEAIARLSDCEFEYRIVGDGPDRSQVEKTIEDLRLQGKVKLLGSRGDVSALLRDADIFLMPSKYEGFGLAALEAMNAGLAIVASGVAGLRELVGESTNSAILVNAESPSSIARGVQKFLQSSALRMEYGKRAFERSLNFSLDKTADEYLAIYRELRKRAA